MPIPEINVDQVGIPDIPKWLTSSPPQAIPIYPPVTQQIGVPIIDIPGCVEAHEQNTSKEKSGILSEDDPKGVRTFCDAGMPSFNPLDYNKDKLEFEYEAPIPKVKSPEQPEVAPPAATPTGTPTTVGEVVKPPVAAPKPSARAI